MKIRHAAILTSMMLALPMAASADLDKAVEKRAEAQYDAAKKRAELEYDSSKERCRALEGNARDVCVKEAEAAHTHAMADAEVKRKAAEAQADTLEDRAEANYKAAKERCDSLSGSAKDSCLADAKVLYRQWACPRIPLLRCRGRPQSGSAPTRCGRRSRPASNRMR